MDYNSTIDWNGHAKARPYRQAPPDNMKHNYLLFNNFWLLLQLFPDTLTFFSRGAF